jgi:NAD(P)-dependent dehydrogenase (short-subunit alcohol dehydrogenase family)
LAEEWAVHNIRASTISPVYMSTELNKIPVLEAQKIWQPEPPVCRLKSVDELNNSAVFMASNASIYMTGSDHH